MTEGQPIVAGALIGGRYRVDVLLGRGGMSSVYRARDESLGRTVAIKILDARPSNLESVRRERAEIELLASLSHHALVTLFDASVDLSDGTDRTFLVMELVDGPDLGSRIAAGPIAPADIAVMAVDLADALHTVHESGVVHRDVKPANVLLGPSALPGQEFSAKLADFGIAHLIDSTRITSTGTVIGTAAYLSPEQAQGGAVGSSSDIYSLGLVLLEAHTRARAFSGTMVETLSARLSRDPEIPASLGDEWKSLLASMTLRDEDARPTALEVAIAARSLQAADSPTSHSSSAPTLRMDTVDAPTLLLPGPVAERSEATSVTERFEPAIIAGARPPARKAGVRSNRAWAVIALVAVVVIIVAIVSIVTSLNIAAAPTLPAVPGQLGIDLKDLMKSVMP
jgi:serine/threonine protein kinase